MDLSQLVDDSPLRLAAKQGGELYNERHRLALEELLSGGPDIFLEFLQREKIPNFLSQDEIQWLRCAAVLPRCVSLLGEDEQGPDQSLRGSADCSSVTYFPEVSDLEPPLLELGWPAFTIGSYRGATRAVAHFQPSYGECIYGCKEAARRMINGAKEVGTDEVYQNTKHKLINLATTMSYIIYDARFFLLVFIFFYLVHLSPCKYRP